MFCCLFFSTLFMFCQCYIHNKSLSNTQSHIYSFIFWMSDIKESIIKKALSACFIFQNRYKHKYKPDLSMTSFLVEQPVNMNKNPFVCLQIKKSIGKDNMYSYCEIYAWQCLCKWLPIWLCKCRLLFLFFWQTSCKTIRRRRVRDSKRR